MININQTRIIISTLIVSFIFILGISGFSNENAQSNRDNIIANIDEDFAILIADQTESKFMDEQKKWGYSMIEFNPKSGTVKNSTVKNGEFAESVYTLNK